MEFLGEQLPKAAAIELATAIRIAAAARREGVAAASEAVSPVTMIDWFLLLSRSPLRYVGTPLRSYRSGGTCFYCFSMFSFAGVKLWLNCQPGVLSWDLGHYFFGCCLVNSCGGLFR